MYALAFCPVPAVLPSKCRWWTRYANSALQCTPARSARKDPEGSHSADWLWFEGRWGLVRVSLPAQEMGLGSAVIFAPSFLPLPGQCSLALWGLCCPPHLSLSAIPFQWSHLTTNSDQVRSCLALHHHPIFCDTVGLCTLLYKKEHYSVPFLVPGVAPYSTSPVNVDISYL